MADHQIGEVSWVEPADRLCRGDPPASQHGDAIGDGDDLAQLVGDEHDADALGAQASDGGEQGLDVERCQDRRRLVEDQDAAIVVQGLEDLDTLAFTD